MVDRREDGLPDRVTMPLLTLITQQAVDEDYSQAAERRLDGADRPSRNGGHRTAAVVALVFGVLVTTAAIQTSLNADAENAGRNTLIDRVVAEREALTAQQDLIVGHRTANASLTAELESLTAESQATVNRLRRLQVSTGHIAVQGEGVRIEVDNPPNADPSENVRQDDLAILINGLLQAGAEAISVNDFRLTVLTSISNTGPAININRQALVPPYVIRAVGDSRTLQARFAESSSGSEFTQLARDLGFGFTMHNEGTLSLPAATLRTLRHVGIPPDRAGREEKNQ